MDAYVVPESFWEQNRFIVALVLTVGIMVVLGVGYVLVLQKDRVSRLAQHIQVQGALKTWRLLLGGVAATVLVLSLFPRRELEMGVLLYFILWPLLGLQFGIAWLPWERFAQRNSTVAIIAAIGVAWFALHVDVLMLKLANYM